MITDIKKLAIASATGFAISFAATASSAATFVYDLYDHPDGANADSPHNHDYGLRLDQEIVGDDPTTAPHFSFGGSSTAQLTFNDVTGVATIEGTMLRSVYGSGLDETDPWTVFY